MNRFEDFANSQAGRATILTALILCGLFVIYGIVGLFSGSQVEQLSRSRMFVCSKTGKAFELELQPGMQVPVLSPYSGSNTGYIAEACYWTKEGKIKGTPTWVLLNEAIKKPGPTFCPDCGRLVVGHNPFPQPSDTPPPVETEYIAGGIQR